VIPETPFYVQVRDEVGQIEATSKITIEGSLNLSGKNPLLDLTVKGENLLPAADKLFIFATLGRPVNPSPFGSSISGDTSRPENPCDKVAKDEFGTTFGSRVVQPEFDFGPRGSDETRLKMAIPSSRLYGGEGDILLKLRVIAPNNVKFTEKLPGGTLHRDVSKRDVDFFLRIHRQNITY
jgi:hypothetical protein